MVKKYMSLNTLGSAYSETIIVVLS